MLENCHEIILKVTRDCNLRCAYCYLRDKDRFRDERMSFAVFQRIVERYIADHDKNISGAPPRLQIIFHGGEPTLLEVREMIRFMNYARSRLPYVSFSMQTNLTNISAELAVVLRQYHIQPGISVDGWGRRFHALRMGRRASPVLKNTRFLKKYNVSCGPLMVVNKTNIARLLPNIKRLLKYFAISQLKANYVENIYSTGNAAPEVTASELFQGQFLPLLRYFQKTGRLIESNLDSILHNFFYSIFFGRNNDPDKDHLYDHCFTRFCAGGNYIVEADAEGTLCFCGRWDDTHALCVLGSVYAADPWGIFSYSKALALHRQKAAHFRVKRCDFCPAQQICDYGCLAFSYAKYRDIRIREDLVCAYYQQINAYLRQNATAVLAAYARYQKWPLRQKHKTLIVELPDSLPPLNKDSLAQLPNWSIFQSGGKAVLLAEG